MSSRAVEVLLATGLAALLMAAGLDAAPAVPADVEWPTYTGNWDGSRYKPLDQINASNFSNLEVV
jgi:glucose dehydrogenase